MKSNFYKNKTIYIFGGSCGIGFATACELAKHGAHIHIFARREDILKEAHQKIASLAASTSTVSYSSVDVISANETIQAVLLANEKTGTPDIVINCVGAARPNYFENITAEQFEHTLKLNVLSVRNIAAAALPKLKETKGHLVNTSSVAGFIGTFGYTDYSASKFAIVGFSEALQQEVRSHGVSVSVIYPPDTYTEGFEEEEKTKPVETKALSKSNKPMTAKEMANAIVSALPSRKFNIIAGFDSKMTYLLKRCFPGIVSWVINREIKKAQTL